MQAHKVRIMEIRRIKPDHPQAFAQAMNALVEVQLRLMLRCKCAKAAEIDGIRRQSGGASLLMETLAPSNARAQASARSRTRRFHRSGQH